MSIIGLLGEDEYSFTVETSGGPMKIAKTPGTMSQLSRLRSKSLSPDIATLTPATLGGGVPTTPTPLRPDYMPEPTEADFLPASGGAQAQPAGMGMGMIPVQTTVQAPQQSVTTERKVISPAGRAALEKAYGAQAAAVEAELQVQQDLARQQAETLAATQGQYDASYERQNQALAQKRAAYDEKRAQYDQAVERFAQAKLKDPEAEQGFVSKLAGAIAVGLGAYASAKLGGPNVALQIINQQIDRQMALQRAQIEKSASEVSLRRNDLALLKEELGDISQAEAAYRTGLLEKARMQVEIFAAKSKSPQLQATAQKLIAGIEAEKAKTFADSETSIVRMVDQTGGTSVTFGPSTKAMSPLDTPLGRAASEPAANKVREVYMDLDVARGAVKTFQDNVAKYGSIQMWGTKAKGEYREALAEMKDVLRVLANAGVLNPGEDVKFESELAGVKTKEQVLAYAAKVENRLVRKENALRKAYIVSPNRPQSSTFQPM